MPPSRRTGSRARSDSIASVTSFRSRVSAETRRNPIDAVAESAFRRMSATPIRSSASRSSSSVGSCGSSATDRLGGLDLLGVDLFERCAVLEALDLALGRIALRQCEVRRRADLLRGRHGPLDQLLEPLTGRNRLAALEVDELAREAPADR